MAGNGNRRHRLTWSMLDGMQHKAYQGKRKRFEKRPVVFQVDW
jgi:hypothetical protein